MNDIYIEIMASSPGYCEKVFGRLPILGKGISAGIYRRRYRRFARMIQFVLDNRCEDFIKAKWMEGTYDYRIASRLMMIAQDCVGWDPPRFIPDDPLIIVYWSYEDFMDYDEAIQEIEDEFNVDLSKLMYEIPLDCTFGSFVSVVTNKTKKIM